MDEQFQNALKGLHAELRSQIAEATAGAPAERIDEIVYEILALRLGLTREELLEIDLKGYDQLRTYPTYDGTDWPRMRDRIAFLQSAVRAGVPWPKVVLETIGYFGPNLKPPFHAISEPLHVPAYQPPSFHISRHTPPDWKQQAEAGWKQHRDNVFHLIQTQFNQLIESGKLEIFDRPRVSRNPSGKETIIEQDAGFKMAAQRFFLGTTWADLAVEYPPKGGYSGSPAEKARQKKKRANQIRNRVPFLLERVGLPTAR